MSIPTILTLSLMAVSSLTLAACATPDILAQAKDDHRYRCERFGGYERCHYVIEPAGAPRAVILALHPAYTSPERVERLSGFAAFATQQGFTVLYPEGVERHWNDGRGAGRTATVANGVDDVAYLTALAERYGNGRPVFLIGMSNGGMMAMRLAIESPHHFAGLASVVGNLPQSLLKADLADYKPLPVWLLFGSQDGIVPAAGGPLFDRGDDWGVVASQAETAEFFARANGHRDWAETRQDNSPDETALTIRTATGGTAPVTAITVEGGGHTWPGEPAWYAWVFRRGVVSQEMNATQTIIDWINALLPRNVTHSS